MKKNPWFRFLILQCCAVTVSVSQLKAVSYTHLTLPTNSRV